MPPLQALVALHGLWTLALLPIAVWAASKWPPRRLRFLGFALAGIGGGALLIIGARELVGWLPLISPANRKYVVQRILFVLATTTDIPVLPLLAIGVALLVVARRRLRRDASLTTVKLG
jgi:hypothetical protein